MKFFNKDIYQISDTSIKYRISDVFEEDIALLWER